MDKAIAGFVVSRLKDRGKTVATAESCTGRLLGKMLTDISGSSAVYPGGVISYCNAVKHELLGVSRTLLESFGAVSEPVACAMAEGVRAQIKTDFAISTTGVAGPNRDERENPVGLVYIAVSGVDQTVCRALHLQGNREQIRMQAAEKALHLLLEILE